MQNEISPEDYGFKIVREKDGIKDFSFVGIEDDATSSKVVIILTVLDDIYTLSYRRIDGAERMVANRYICRTKEEFDFLLQRGRLGNFFK